jgi:hypothetical protein
MRFHSFAAALLLAIGVSACSKCDVPTWGFSGFLAPSACSSETPRR